MREISPDLSCFSKFSDILDIHPKYFPRFMNIGYKHYTMPKGLSIVDYDRYIDYAFTSYGIVDYSFRKKKYEEMDICDWKEFDNFSIRFQIILYLEDIPESNWREKEFRLLNYVISDIDFFQSENQFWEIFESERQLREIFE